MELRTLLADDQAVSPVIGVVLMVAITVILAAVIGTFVLGLGDQISNNAPQASFTFDYDETATTLNATHDGGDSIERARLTFKSSDADGKVTDAIGSDKEVSAGDTLSLSKVDPVETARITWESQGGGSTATLAKWTGPDA